jgi:hypothetical protein
LKPTPLKPPATILVTPAVVRQSVAGRRERARGEAQTRGPWQLAVSLARRLQDRRPHPTLALDRHGDNRPSGEPIPHSAQSKVGISISRSLEPSGDIRTKWGSCPRTVRPKKMVPPLGEMGGEADGDGADDGDGGAEGLRATVARPVGDGAAEPLHAPSATIE